MGRGGLAAGPPMARPALLAVPSAKPAARLLLLLAVVAGHGALAQHACEAEVESACPDRPAADIARCLKDETEHDRPTTISSDCTDFIALNVACAGVISTYCDEAFFSRDTALCLSSWVDQSSIPAKCAGVMKWAIPKKEEEESSDGPTDELGMSAKDYAEKQAWRAKHKAERSAAIERMKESDKQKEQKRREMEKLKKENPEEYQRVIAQEEDQRRQKEEELKRERKLQAALERKRREEDGLPPEETEEELKAKRRPRRTAVKPKGTWFEENRLKVAFGVLGVTYVFFNIRNFFSGDKDEKDE